MAISRKASAIETKKKLLKAGKEIIKKKGLTNVSIEEITEAAGVSKGTFYTYFKRKEDIVYALRSEEIDQIFKTTAAIDTDVINKIRYYMINFCKYVEDSGIKLSQEWTKSIICSEPDEETDGKYKFSLHLNCVLGILNKAVEKGELKNDTPVETLASSLIEILWGQMYCWAIHAGTYSVLEHTQNFCDNYLDSFFEKYLT